MKLCHKETKFCLDKVIDPLNDSRYEISHSFPAGTVLMVNFMVIFEQLHHPDLITYSTCSDWTHL
jgi:hypothetical protein